MHQQDAQDHDDLSQQRPSISLGDPMTPDDLSQAQQLLEGASNGPWHVDLDDEGNSTVRKINDGGFVADCGLNMPGDAAFIAACRTLVPQLLDEISQLRGEYCSIRESAKRFDLSPAELTIRFSYVEANYDNMEEENRQLRLIKNVYREILDAVSDEERCKAISRTCPSNECMIREKCAAATFCRSEWLLAVAADKEIK
jgi:hypothetical protein